MNGWWSCNPTAPVFKAQSKTLHGVSHSLRGCFSGTPVSSSLSIMCSTGNSKFPLGVKEYVMIDWCLTPCLPGIVSGSTANYDEFTGYTTPPIISFFSPVYENQKKTA